ncbi:hypothetical protein ACQKIE_16255 [Luteibacter sp. NPDC031894]|uniref:hypothetical protein n=1 Tax=Luteibacter sp. NPDC031894 TaxID=3390572 RepID=UPI003D04A5A9
MNQVIVFPRGQLSAEDKASMRDAGIVAVEADDPSKVVTVIPVAPSAPMATPDDFTMSLLGALDDDAFGYGQCRAIKELHRRMLAREKAKAVQS